MNQSDIYDNRITKRQKYAVYIFKVTTIIVTTVLNNKTTKLSVNFSSNEAAKNMLRLQS